MITYGFFDSVEGDKTYYADDFNSFFEGLIPDNGIFEHATVQIGDIVDDFRNFEIRVLGVNGAVYVGGGKAMVNGHWVKMIGSEQITPDAPHSLFDRYDKIALRCDTDARTVSLVYEAGVPSTEPQMPQPTRTETLHEIVIGYLSIKANADKITNADIIDCRHDTYLCGVITGLIQQVNTTQIYRQYTTAFNQLINDMKKWQEEQKTAYTEWFSTLTQDLTVNTNLSRTTANYLTTREDGTQYVDLPESLNYTEGDILNVYVNGVLLVPNIEYELTMNEVENVPMIFIFSDIDANNIITFDCMKNTSGTTV